MKRADGTELWVLDIRGDFEGQATAGTVPLYLRGQARVLTESSPQDRAPCFPSHHPVPHYPLFPGLQGPLGNSPQELCHPHEQDEILSRAAHLRIQKCWWELLTDIWGQVGEMRFKAKAAPRLGPEGRYETSLGRPPSLFLWRGSESTPSQDKPRTTAVKST